jgi:hypothetical protein
MNNTPLYLARLDMYSRFLTAADAESHVVWHRQDGRYAGEREAVDAVDTAYAATRASLCGPTPSRSMALNAARVAA